jgi:hypothetical protein
MAAYLPDTPPAAGRAWVPGCRARTFRGSVTPFYDETPPGGSSRRDRFVISIGNARLMYLITEPVPAMSVHFPALALFTACRPLRAPRGRQTTRGREKFGVAAVAGGTPGSLAGGHGIPGQAGQVVSN